MSSDDVSARLPSVICMPKVVRDLLWTVTSPHLLSGHRFPVLPPEFGLEALKFDVVIDWLNGLVTDPTPLLVFLQETTSNGRSLALGVYFSTLLEYWLRFCPHLGMEKMEIGKQIVSSTNRTVGQLKFLFRCNFASTQEARDQHRDFHVESSVKFFLLNSVDNGRNGFLIDSSSEDDRSMERNSHVPLEQFVGPHLGENLAWRVQEVERKLAMCRGESVRAWLEKNYSDNVQSHIVLRGYLFKPLHHFESTSQTTVAHDWCFHRNPAKGVGMDMSSNPSIATDHLRGWWTTAMETDLPAKVRANALQGFGESRFVILPKLQWLSPVVAVESTQSGQIYVEGDNRLDSPEVGALTLDELMAFVREHFQKVASAAEANKTVKTAISTDEGFIKPDADEITAQDEQKRHEFVEPATDPVMMQTLFKHLSLLNMTKALKRLQKIAAGIHNSTEFTLQAAAHSDSTDEISSHLLGSPVDHAMNRSLNKNRPHELKWKYIDSLEEIEEVIQHLQKCEATLHSEDVSDEQRVAWNALVGIDCEWRPQFLMKDKSTLRGGPGERGQTESNEIDEDQAGLSIYQLAVQDTVYVIDVQVLGKAAAAPLNFIWKSASRLLLIGFCVASDIQRIRNSFPDLGSLFDRRKEETLRRPLLLELKELALFRHVPAKNWGLSKLYRACLGEQVDKEQQCSDWGSRPLSNVQLAYAAKDAYAVQRLALHFLADVSFARARGEGGSVSDSILDYMKGFDACRNFSYSWTVASASHPLGKQHVKAALQALGVQARFLRCDESENAGLLVKSIALLVRKGKQTNAPRRILHAVAVLPLDRSIDMQALGSLLGADPDDVSLADQETLVRVFGYSRGCLGPIGLREQSVMRIIVDDCVKSEDYLLCGAGEADEVYAIAPEVLIKTVDAVVAKISS
ncbi:hypothetical protein PF010_g24921 [Phytophthora fragariae]|uniref:3'-5' exonuclease domain-containing protein n=1 Tax=Phytophthora fragariae TaxID=53985 RepID=A0A6G0K154_9STRA|nr:hypothetical protein PF010_g24921 [Phytophthora fragariae]